MSLTRLIVPRAVRGVPQSPTRISLTLVALPPVYSTRTDTGPRPSCSARWPGLHAVRPSPFASTATRPSVSFRSHATVTRPYAALVWSSRSSLALGRDLRVYVTRLSRAADFGTIRRCPLPSAQAKPYTAVAASAGGLRVTVAAAVAQATSRRMDGLPRRSDQLPL